MKKKLAIIAAACACLALSICMLAGCSSSSSAKYKIVDTLQDEHYAVAFKAGNTDLAAVVNDAIAQLDKNGKVKELVNKYAEYGMSYDDWCFKAPATASTAKFDGLNFIVGFDAEYPPYGFVGNDGQYTGFDLDLAKMVCELEGWKFSCVAIDWDAKDALLESGQITCIWNGLTAEGRENLYALSANYMLNGQVVVVKSSSSVAKAADLAGKVVVTQTGSAGQELLAAGGDQEALAKTFKSLQTVPDYAEAFMQLDSGAVDAVVCDKSIANTYMSKSK